MKTINLTTEKHQVMSFRLFSLATKCLFLSLMLGCGEEKQAEQIEESEGLPLSALIQNEEFWEGSAIEFNEHFFMKEDLCYKAEGNYSFSGLIKIRALNGSLTALKSYLHGKPNGDFLERHENGKLQSKSQFKNGMRHGDFLEWHENGKLQSKSQFKNGMRHGDFYIWTKDGIVYSRKYFQDDYEDLGRFEDQGASESGKSLAAIELEKWEGTGAEFYHKFAGDPKRGGILHIRETEELYNGTITAIDDKGRKEALLRYSNGKYHGTISKWNEAEVLWEEAEFDRGELVEFTIKNGKPFDAAQIIDLSKDPSSVDMLFKQ
jgi:antitoxin component YwqK of YwqJK toxin-antitoxin module